jgi:hypothetical protein
MDRTMAPRLPAATPGRIYALIGIGFAGLIGAHEFGAMSPDADDVASIIVPFILAAAGTLAFVVAGLMATRLLRGGGPR